MPPEKSWEPIGLRQTLGSNGQENDQRVMTWTIYYKTAAVWCWQKEKKIEQWSNIKILKIYMDSSLTDAITVMTEPQEKDGLFNK